MTEFTHFMARALPGGPVAAHDIFYQVYAQRKMFNLAHEFWIQLRDEMSGEFELAAELVPPLNTSVRISVCLLWMIYGPQAAADWLEMLLQIPFISQNLGKNIIQPLTRELWAGVWFTLGQEHKRASTGQAVNELIHPGLRELEKIVVMGNLDDILTFPADRLAEPPIVPYLWAQSGMEELYRSAWEQQRYDDAHSLVQKGLPFSLSIPWRAGLEARWWDFQVHLALHGQEKALEKLAALQEHEEKFQDAMEQSGLPYTDRAREMLRREK